MFNSSKRAKLWLGASVATLIAAGSAGAAYAADAEPIETVVVTGFKESLERALDMKRNALDSSDSILAEDIAKFPDLNVSESLQRIPGVTLARDSGEGKQISVRGLNSTFTRVRINGIEALATGGSQDIQGGANRGRSFDFNVFASELFNSLTVHKSSSADVEEGSLGATVDLHTAHPFDYDKFTLVGSFQGGYNDLAGSFNPRGAVLVSDTFFGGTVGVLFSGAYQVQNVLENGASTVRWQNDNTAQNAAHSEPLIAGCVTNVPGASSQCATGQRFASVAFNPPGALPGAAPDATQIATVGAYVVASGGLPNRETRGAVANGANFSAATLPNNYDIVNEAFHPRFPRYDDIGTHEKRLGLTGSIQWQPDEATLFTLDGMFADFAETRQEYYLEAESFSNNNVSNAPAGLRAPILGIGSINILSYALDPVRNNLNAVTASNVGLRTEHRLDHLDTRFQQLTLDGSHTFSDDFKVHGLLGWSESHHHNPIQTTLTLDYNCTTAGATPTAIGGACPGGATGGAGTVANPFSFDYTGANSRAPIITFGNVDVTSPNGWFLSQIRERQNFVFNSYRTAQGDFTWKALDWLNVSGGIDWKNYGYHALVTSRSNGTNASQDMVIPAAIENAALASYTTTHTMHGAITGGATPTSWIVPDINTASSLFGIFDPTAFTTVIAAGGAPCNAPPGCGAFQMGVGQFVGQNGEVHENDLGLWLQADWDAKIGNVPFRGNVGGRYVETDQHSIGYNYVPSTKTIASSTVTRSYHDFLPSANAVLEPAEDFLIRLSGAYVMARPDLGNLLPGGATATVAGSNFTVTETNPNLKPFRAKTIDLSFEWYYSKGALFSAAFFYKHIDSLIQSLRSNIPFNTNPDGVPNDLAIAACGAAYVAPPATGCNEAAIWTFTKPVNVKGAPLYGMEINWQQPFDFLPHPFDSFGFLGNLTFVQATQTYFNTDGSVFAKLDLQGLSRTSYNATLYYDDSTFQARVTAAFRSKYIPNGGTNPGNLNDVLINTATLNIDASASYKWDDNFTVTFDAINLTNQHQYQYADSIGQRLYFDHQTGTNYFIGLRYNY